MAILWDYSQKLVLSTGHDADLGSSLKTTRQGSPKPNSNGFWNTLIPSTRRHQTLSTMNRGSAESIAANLAHPGLQKNGTSG